MPASRLCRVVALAALTLGAACERATGPSGDLRLDISLDRSIVSAGDSVRVTLTLTNVAAHSIPVIAADAYGACYHAFEAFDRLRRPVAVPTAFCLDAAAIIGPRTVELAAGDHITIADWWDVGASTVNGRPLAPGMYRVRGAVGSSEGTLHSRERALELVPARFVL